MFDTGTKGQILLYNMEKLKINPKTIDIVVISHNHLDHTGGLLDFLRVNQKAKIYVPNSFPNWTGRIPTIKVSNPTKIAENVFSTGELKGIEQSLVVGTSKGFVVVTGCSHPGLKTILTVASTYGKIYGVVGGFHGFNEFEILKNIHLICPCHCTMYKEEIYRLFPNQCVKCEVGKVLELSSKN